VDVNGAGMTQAKRNVFIFWRVVSVCCLSRSRSFTMSYDRKLFVLTAFLLALPIAAPLGLDGQQLPTVTGVKVQASVQQQIPGQLLFQYAVSNPSSNTDSVIMIGLDVSQGPGTQTLATDDLPTVSNGFSPAVAPAIQQSKHFVPAVGVVASAPAGWMVTPSVDGRILWGQLMVPLIRDKALQGFKYTLTACLDRELSLRSLT